MKKVLKYLGFSILILALFRGIIYRMMVQYSSIGDRTEILITNDKLLALINEKSIEESPSIHKIARIANEITIQELQFSAKKFSSDPNKLIDSHLSNCVGYSSMFNSIANYLIRFYNLEREISAKHLIGKLSIAGFNLHQYLNNPFLKDHDFNEIVDLKTGEKIFIDPSLSDYLWIDRVNVTVE